MYGNDYEPVGDALLSGNDFSVLAKKKKEKKKK
jgi:hypothetical protein